MKCVKLDYTDPPNPHNIIQSTVHLQSLPGNPWMPDKWFFEGIGIFPMPHEKAKIISSQPLVAGLGKIALQLIWGRAAPKVLISDLKFKSWPALNRCSARLVVGSSYRNFVSSLHLEAVKLGSECRPPSFTTRFLSVWGRDWRCGSAVIILFSC
jgi:hypothetical protein